LRFGNRGELLGAGSALAIAGPD